jgi:peptidoglycan-associated lipoprotein
MKLTTATILAAMLLAGPGCRNKKNTRVVDPGDETGGADRTSGKGIDTDRDDGEGGSTTTVKADDGDSMPQLAAIYFEFDSSTLSEAARDELERLAAWLTKHPKARITIEGHTDDRGTDEYNIALGDRRARVIQQYLARLGVEPARLATISYGEERPAASGSDEEAWAQNRRGELVPKD